jgi:MoxR-like ATPase
VSVAQAADRCRAVLDEVDRVVVGKREAVRLILLGVLAGGHVLVEDLPGLGKTLIAKSLSTALGLGFSRVQFTPDLLPADVTGAVYLDQRSDELVFRRGPVFANLVLADEINRATPKTQSALLEAMAERQVTVDGTSHRLPDPFVVLACGVPLLSQACDLGTLRGLLGGGVLEMNAFKLRDAVPERVQVDHLG